MKRLTTKEILDKIDHLEAFEAVSQRGGFKIKIDSYVPYIGTAIHAGNNLRKELNYRINLSGFHRWQEEDPCTDEFIKGLPITLVALDSRYEYDLNRDRKSCIYDVAWGREVWREKPDSSQLEESLAKHDEFYEVAAFLIRRLESLFPEVFIFDLHSYNYRRNDEINYEAPLFNLGTHFIRDSFRDRACAFLEEVARLNIDAVDNLSGENVVFYGKGYLAEFVNTHFCKTTVFPLEVKKVYCNENNGIYYRAIIDAIGGAVHQAILSFIKKNTDNISYHTLNNFSGTIETEVDLILAKRIAELVQRNYRESNRGEYTNCEIEHLTSNKTPEVMVERIKESFLIYARRREKVVGCGILIKKEDHIEAKMLNVDPSLQGMGVAKKISTVREKFARREGYSHLYIESLKYEKTISFHSRRGFYPVQSPRKLKYSIYMRKDI